MHTLFLREHNRIAENLIEILEDDSDEEIYQKARRLVIAEYQNIVYGEFLKHILGESSMAKYGLNVDEKTYYRQEEDPSLINSFATAAYRFGHSLIQRFNNMAKVDNLDNVSQVFQLRDNFFNMDRYLDNSGMGMEEILAGLMGQPSQRVDRFVTEDVTNFLQENKSKRNTKVSGSDLVARNIQRGRDHGLPGYNQFRKFCRLRPLPSFKSGQNPSEMSLSSWRLLSELYHTKDDIDLYVGGLSEYPLSGAISGPTFNCMKSIMFKRLKDGDRFFFTHTDQIASFPREQLDLLRKRTLRDIICENTKISQAREDVFKIYGNLKPCSIVNDLNIKKFVKA